MEAVGVFFLAVSESCVAKRAYTNIVRNMTATLVEVVSDGLFDGRPRPLPEAQNIPRSRHI